MRSLGCGIRSYIIHSSFSFLYSSWHYLFTLFQFNLFMGYVAFYSPHRFIRLFDRARQCGVRDNNKHQQHQSIAIAENINGITNFNTQDISNVINTKTQKHSSATRQQQQHSRARFVCVCVVVRSPPASQAIGNICL